MENLVLIGEHGIIGKYSLILIIGISVFLYSYKNTILIFDWVEVQTLGTRTYLLEKLDLLFIKIDPDKLTYYLLLSSLLFFTITLLFFGLLINWILGLIFAFIAGFLSFKIPKPIVDYFVEKRIKKFSLQIVDALQLLSNGIRAGLSVPQSLGMVVDEMPSPVSDEFSMILQQNRIGVTLEECFENLAKRIPTEDIDMFVTSVNILRETGGNLAEVFDTIVVVIRERLKLQQKIDTYIAQGMFQGTTIALMPFAITGIQAASDPESVARMFTNPIGIAMMIVALMLVIAGYLVILKIVKIEV